MRTKLLAPTAVALAGLLTIGVTAGPALAAKGGGKAAVSTSVCKLDKKEQLRPAAVNKVKRPKPIKEGKLTAEQRAAIKALQQQFQQDCRGVVRAANDTIKSARDEGKLMLMSIREELKALTAQRAEMADAGEDTTDIDAQIAVVKAEFREAKSSVDADLRDLVTAVRQETNDTVRGMKEALKQEIDAIIGGGAAPVDPAPVDPEPVDPAPVDPAPVDPGV